MLSRAPASASDFWDAVRTPGLAKHREDLEGARRALGAGHPRRALDLSGGVLERVSGYAGGLGPWAHVLSGRALGMLERSVDAVSHFERALALDPAALDDETVGPIAADVALRAGRFDLAERILRRVLGSMGPSMTRQRLFVRYGDAMLAQGPDRLRDALLAYRQGSRNTSAGDVDARIGFGLALLRAEDGGALDVVRPLTTYPLADRVIASLPLPAQERSARQALLFEAFGDLEAARDAWQAAARQPGPWREHARQAVGRLQSGPPPEDPPAKATRR